MRKGKVLDGDFGTLATSQRKARNRWRKVVTPSGLESGPNTAKDHENSESPTENLLLPKPKKRFTKRDGSKVAKLAILAANAVRNADLHRALELIEEIRVIGEGTPAAETNLQVGR